jgi:hypothetical protein
VQAAIRWHREPVQRQRIQQMRQLREEYADILPRSYYAYQARDEHGGEPNGHLIEAPCSPLIRECQRR